MVYSPCRNERLSCEGGKAMSAKRRDKKNRILRSGESQTKDGRYKYTFYEGGKQRAFYSWKLERMAREVEMSDKIERRRQRRKSVGE